MTNYYYHFVYSEILQLKYKWQIIIIIFIVISQK